MKTRVTTSGIVLLASSLIGMQSLQAQDAPPVRPANAQRSQSEEESIRTLVKAFADARNARDGQLAAALYSEDGEYISSEGYSVRGRPALASLWSSVTGQVQRTISSIDFPGGNISVVRVVTQYDDGRGRHGEAFVCVRDDGKWRIRVHQSVD